MTKKKEPSEFQERTADDKRFRRAMVEDCLKVIEEVQLHITSLTYATDFANRHNRGSWQNSTLSRDASDLRTALMHIELEEWRKLLMWGLIVEPKERARIKAMVKDRFLDGKAHIASFLNPSHVDPGQYWSADADHFRAMVDKLFAPQENEGG